MNNTTLTGEKVEVMALFNYSKIPCQPLYFRKRGGDEVEITETTGTRIKFIGGAAKHIFECFSSCHYIRHIKILN